MSECPKKGDVSDLCPRGICQGYGQESIAGGSRYIDRCTVTDKQCDATQRDWDGPYSPYCYRFQLSALADLRMVAEGLAEALNATGLGRHHRRKPDWMDEALDAYDAWKKAHP